MRRLVSIAIPLALAGAVVVTATASKSHVSKTAGVVVGAPQGDTLLVRIGKAKPARVQILGVRAPAGSACGAGASAAQARSLTLGRKVTLVGDLAHGAYVQLPGGVDLGAQLLTRGAAQIDVWGARFARFAAYVPLQESAEHAAQGMWGACAADVSVSLSGPDQGLPGQSLTYAVVVRNAGPLTARGVELRVRPGNYAEELVRTTTTAGSCAPKDWMAVCTLDALPAGSSTSVTVVLRGRRFGALSARAEVALPGCVLARCGGTALLDPKLDNDRAATVTILPGGGYEKACDKSYPTVCIPLTPPDLDCADFLPLKQFAVRYDVPNADPHHLDGNGDGFACEGEDY